MKKLTLPTQPLSEEKDPKKEAAKKAIKDIKALLQKKS